MTETAEQYYEAEREACATEATRELPDNIRVPLHSLQADWQWLMARFATEPDMRPALTQAVEDRLSQLETALYEHFLSK